MFVNIPNSCIMCAFAIKLNFKFIQLLPISKVISLLASMYEVLFCTKKKKIKKNKSRTFKYQTANAILGDLKMERNGNYSYSFKYILLCVLYSKNKYYYYYYYYMSFASCFVPRPILLLYGFLKYIYFFFFIIFNIPFQCP